MSAWILAGLGLHSCCEFRELEWNWDLLAIIGDVNGCFRAELQKDEAVEKSKLSNHEGAKLNPLN